MRQYKWRPRGRNRSRRTAQRVYLRWLRWAAHYGDIDSPPGMVRAYNLVAIKFDESWHRWLR